MSSISQFAGSVPFNYDKYLGPVLFEPYALDLASRLKKERVRNMLELACGTGRLTAHLVDLIPGDGSLVATDLNPAMLQLAQSKVQHKKIEWKVADAQELPFTDEKFNHVVCQFGVKFFPDKTKSFREAYRVLKSGGNYLFNTWDSLENNPRIDTMWRVLYEVFGNESPDMAQGPHSFYNRDEITELLTQAGFINVSIETVAKTCRYNRPEDLIIGFADGSPLNRYLSEKDEKSNAVFRKRLKEALQKQDSIFGNTVPSLALVVEASKGE